MNDALLMTRCLELAANGKGTTAPNPMVGAVLVHNGRIIAEGWHHQYGGKHAEVDCLDNVAEADKYLIPESTMYVTLEPCAHHGKTPPCAHRLVREGIKKVVIANADPFALVGGRGIAILKEAGIAVETGLLAAEGAWLNRRFFCFHTRQLPYVVLKWAQTADGFIAPANRSRYQITNTHSQQLVHKWRTEEGAIMVGATTALNDDPALTARLWAGRQPLRIAIDRNLRLPVSHQLLNSEAPTWILNATTDEVRGKLTFLKVDFNTGILPQLLKLLHEASILSLIVEGGSALLNSFIAAGLWDEARVFTGPAALGSGVAAPQLHNATKAFSTTLTTDRLLVFVHSEGSATYLAGADL